jgi:hypothetical protein
MSPDRSASLLARLLAQAKRTDVEHGHLLHRFMIERLLARLAASDHGDRFVLKGALLFAVWYDEPHRPTRDIDLLGHGPADAPTLLRRFRDIVRTPLDDGVDFDPSSLHVEPIRETQTYGGWRLRLLGRTGSARCPIQIDVAFGDALPIVTPVIDYPVLLSGFEAPRLRAYPVHGVVAEKYHAMVALGMANTRLKDFFDLGVIARRTRLDGASLASAIAATFARRNTPLPAEVPVALTTDFALAPPKQVQWAAFHARLRLSATPLPATVALLHDLLWPATVAAATGSGATATWDPDSGRWT